MMRKMMTVAAALLCAAASHAQQPASGWQNQSPEDGVFGAAITRMHEAAKGVKPACKPVTVALIGFGADIDHKAIKGAVWNNPKEKPNGRDDDRNGWIDDLHGWNFLGSATETLDIISGEGDRSYLLLRDKYRQYTMLREGKAYGYNDDANDRRMVELPLPRDVKELEYYLRAKAESRIAEVDNEQRVLQAQTRFMKEIDRKMREEFPGRKLTIQDMADIVNRPGTPQAMVNMGGLTGVLPMVVKSQDWDTIMEYAREHIFPSVDAPEQSRDGVVPREIMVTGDDMYDLGRKGYGNGNLMAENATMGTMQAGLIAASDNSTVEGAAPGAKVMFLRVDANERGESHVKDVALAIRYAVDKGAQVIQLGRGNTLYPYRYSQWVDDALRYAERKGVLVVIPVMDLSYDMEETPFYPNRHTVGGELTNVITVAASDADGNPLAGVNFGPKYLDIFAPGVDVESTYPGNAYAVGSGSYLAAAMVTGVAAFIKGYFPKITPAEMRGVLMESVTPRGDAEVEKQFYFNGKLVTDIFLFDQLSASGGILNGAKAFEAARKLK